MNSFFQVILWLIAQEMSFSLIKEPVVYLLTLLAEKGKLY